MNGDQFSGLTNVKPAAMKNSTAASLMATITALKRALSRTPTTSSPVMNSTMIAAGRLITAPSVAQGDAVIHTGRCRPKPARMRWKYPLQPTATVIDPTAYSRMRSQPIIQAKISPSVAYA